MTHKKRFTSQIKQLGVAMINATLMLALILVVMIWIVLGRLQSLADATRVTLTDALAPQATQLTRLASGVEQLEATLASAEGQSNAAEQIGALRKDIQNIQAEIRSATTLAPRLLAEQVTQTIGEWLAKNRPADPL